jgi:hypothetical protein
MIATTTTRTGTPRRRWWAPRTYEYDRPTEVLAVLQRARAIVEAGWVQNRWTAPAGPTRQADARAGGGEGPADRACLVAAVAVAVRDRDHRADLAVATGPALAFVWDAVFEGHRSGHAAPLSRAAGRSAPHHVRVQRMRELARWNDERGRTRDDVVSALDRAAAAVVAQVVEPAR